MYLSEMIQRLEELRAQCGDVEVLITDGHEGVCYRGDYGIFRYQEDERGQVFVDIGIGGCED